MLDLELSDPAQVLLGYLVAGTGRKTGYLLATCRLIDGGWYGQFIIIDSRKCEVRDRLAKLTISTHVVDRVIQRLGLKDPREAISRLRVPIVGSIELMGGLRDGEHLLVPAEGGAAVLKRSEEDQNKGVLATFIDQDKLRSNQIAEVEAVQRRIEGTEFASDILANSVPYNFS
jgi:hypothetical protein